MKNKIIGLDIGSGFTKCYDGEHKIVFPSVYCYRQPTAWEDESGIIEGVGEKALEIAKYPNTVKLYPIINGKPQYQVFTKIALEALKRVGVGQRDPVPLVSGLPYETGKQERKEVEALLRKHLSLSSLSIYPQALGTLFDLDLGSGTVINIGHATTEILVIEKLNILGGLSEPLASDFIISALSDLIQERYDFKPSTESLLSLLVGRIGKISSFDKATVYRADVEEVIGRSIDYLTDKICYDARAMLTQLPENLDCAGKVILSGGGSLIRGVRKAVEDKLNVRVKVPDDPMFSNVRGFYKAGVKLYG